MKAPSLRIIAAVYFVAPAAAAQARSAYDGSWNLVFVTQEGRMRPHLQLHGLLDRATQLTSIDGKEDRSGDRLHPALLGRGNGRLQVASSLGLHEAIWAAMSAVIVSHKIALAATLLFVQGHHGTNDCCR